jgi:hypothetical protein
MVQRGQCCAFIRSLSAIASLIAACFAADKQRRIYSWLEKSSQVAWQGIGATNRERSKGFDLFIFAVFSSKIVLSFSWCLGVLA